MRAGTQAAAAPPTTSFAVLGMLTRSDRSGYDLAKAIEASVGHFFTPAKSQIYAELRRLVTLGYAQERTVRQKDRPDKRVYHISTKGRRAFKQWLESAPLEEETVRSMILVKLFFGGQMDRRSLITQLEQERTRARDRLAVYRALEDKLQGAGEAALYPYLTVRSGTAHARASIRWADEAIETLKRQA